jgi:hypothetical protein
LPAPLTDSRGYPRIFGASADWGACEFGASILDTDADMIPDWWENFYGFNIKDSADASANPDGDGGDNLAEYNAGTNPLIGDLAVATSARIEAVYMTLNQMNDLVIRLEWTGTSGASYIFEISDEFDVWMFHSTESAGAGTNIKDFPFQGIKMKEFYRIREQP